MKRSVILKSLLLIFKGKALPEGHISTRKDGSQWQKKGEKWVLHKAAPKAKKKPASKKKPATTPKAKNGDTRLSKTDDKEFPVKIEKFQDGKWEEYDRYKSNKAAYSDAEKRGLSLKKPERKSKKKDFVNALIDHLQGDKEQTSSPGKVKPIKPTIKDKVKESIDKPVIAATEYPEPVLTPPAETTEKIPEPAKISNSKLMSRSEFEKNKKDEYDSQIKQIDLDIENLNKEKKQTLLRDLKKNELENKKYYLESQRRNINEEQYEFYVIKEIDSMIKTGVEVTPKELSAITDGELKADYTADVLNNNSEGLRFIASHNSRAYIRIGNSQININAYPDGYAVSISGNFRGKYKSKEDVYKAVKEHSDEIDKSADLFHKQKKYDEILDSIKLPEGKKEILSVKLMDGSIKERPGIGYENFHIGKNESNSYDITHKPSGLKINPQSFTKKMAEEYTKAFLNSGINMNFKSKDEISDSDFNEMLKITKYFTRAGKEVPNIIAPKNESQKIKDKVRKVKKAIK